MGIDDLRKRVFSKETDFEKRFREPTLQGHHEKVETSWKHEDQMSAFKVPETPDVALARKREERGRRLAWASGIGGVALISVFVLWSLVSTGAWKAWFWGGSETLAKLELKVEGGEEILAGKKVIWRVTYANKNEVALEDAVLTFEYPEGAQPYVGEFSQKGMRRERRELGTIAPGTVAEELFDGLVFGPKGTTVQGKVTLEYRPSDSSARYEKEAVHSSFIKATLLGVQFEMPPNLKSGQDVEIGVRVVSSAESAFRNLSLGLQYPNSFEYASAVPEPEPERNVWHIGDLPAGGEYLIKIKGRIKRTDNPESFIAQVGLFDRAANEWAVFNDARETFGVSSSFLTVDLEPQSGESMPDIVQPGHALNMRVNYRNNLSVAVNNVTIEVRLRGAMINLEQVTSGNGAYDAGIGGLVFLPGRSPGLLTVEAGQGGSFIFNIPVLPLAPQTSVGDKNFTIDMEAKIYTNEIPQGYQGIDLTGNAERSFKVETAPQFKQQGYYALDSRIINTGPVPPEVGQETTYTIAWTILNTSNDLDNVAVRATLPSYMKWKGVVVPSSENLTYKESTGQIVWSPGRIAVGTGYVTPPREVVFQVGLTPSVPQRGKVPQIISRATFEARDTFTNSTFTLHGPELSTNLPGSAGAVR